MNAALDLALIDIGAWGLAAIGGATFLAHRMADRARLVNPPREPRQEPTATLQPVEQRRAS